MGRVGFWEGSVGWKGLVSGEGMVSEVGDNGGQLGEESGGSIEGGLGVDDGQIMSCKELEDKDREGEITRGISSNDMRAFWWCR